MYSSFTTLSPLPPETVSPQICSDARWREWEALFATQPAERERLTAAADALMEGPGYSVTFAAVPFPRDPHDYISLSAYAWPNPDTLDGLPWVQRDGILNPQRATTYNTHMDDMVRAVGLLTAAARISGNSRYAARAGFLLKTWFLNSETRMNPHLRLSQWQPGKDSYSPWGLIDAQCLGSLLEAVRSLPLGAEWTADDCAGLRRWFLDFYFWLTGDPVPVKEECAPTNHGTYYDVLKVSSLLFLGYPDAARRQVCEKSIPRLSLQLLADGRMPFELSRTRSLDYTRFNLSAWAILANYAQPLGLDLWNMENGDGGTLRKAFHFALPALIHGKSVWPNTEIGEMDPAGIARLFRLVTLVADEPEAAAWLRDNPEHVELYRTLPCN